ncbi:MAG: ornithine cyclodeaminase family protein [Gemmatimonadota bacterium]
MSQSRRPEVRVFDEWVIRETVDDRLALVAAEHAFRALARGQAEVAPPLGARFAGIFGEIHVKGAHLVGSPFFAFKFATGFYNSIEMGVPTGSGLMLLFDAETGFPRGLLFDNGYLTDLRTAAAGGLAARLLAPARPLRVAIIGAGVQARLQLRLLARVRKLHSVRVWSRRGSSRTHFAKRMEQVIGLPVEMSEDVAQATGEADLIITATPSPTPLISPDMVQAGATIIAVGSDSPDKQELDAHILAQADKIVTDLTGQCAELGELHHALEAGAVAKDCVYAELGQIVDGARPGREGDETIVCDLTGVGVQDAAIAELAFRKLVNLPQKITGKD